ncbi:MAG: hypothetical protein IIC75_01025 [Bacteroidetes bacterium]|nr:hypothetical protein [Bacteroidota bacterium]
MENKNCRGVINYFVQYTSIFTLGPWRNSIQLFTEEGFNVNVYQFADERIKKYRTDLEDKYNLIEIPYPKIIKYLLYILKFFFRLLKKLGLNRLSSFGDGFDVIFKSYYFVLACILKNKSGENEVFIGGDPAGLIAANYLAKKKKGTLIYWSLELYIEKDLNNFGLKHIKKREVECNQNAICTVDFGELRCKILQKENHLSSKTMISIPNFQIGKGKVLRNYYFNNKFKIPRGKKIILHAGGLYSPSLNIKNLWDSIHNWPDDYILVLHTHQKNYPNSGFSIPKKHLNSKIFLNNDFVPYDELDIIYSSCDIGIMIHGSSDANCKNNLYYSDLSVGKMFHHLKVGVPLIVRNLPGYKKLIEENQVGLCMDKPSDILPSIITILNNYESYSLNAVKLHDKLRFELHHDKLFQKINEIVS